MTVLQPSNDSIEVNGPRGISILQTLDPVHALLLHHGSHFVSWTWAILRSQTTHSTVVTFLVSEL